MGQHVKLLLWYFNGDVGIPISFIVVICIGYASEIWFASFWPLHKDLRTDLKSSCGPGGYSTRMGRFRTDSSNIPF